MTYRDAIVEQVEHTLNKNNGNHIILENLEELNGLNGLNDMDDRNNMLKSSHGYNMLLHDIFGDYICNAASEMCEYWSPFGFFDKGCRMQVTMNILYAVKSIATIKLAHEDDIESQTDDDL